MYDLTESDERVQKARLVFEESKKILDLAETEHKHKENFNSNYSQTLQKLKQALKRQRNDTIDNIVITAATQIGKTKAIIDCLLDSQDCISVVTCENKNDQKNQMIQRIKKQDIKVFNVKTLNIKKLVNHYNASKHLVFCILNNASQIKKITALLDTLATKVSFNNYNLYHDEADTVSKTDNVDTVFVNEPSCHTEFIIHCDTLKKISNLNFKRIWISATPENCNYLYNIECKDVYVLPTPFKYKKITKQHEWTSDTQILKEVSRIKRDNTKEVILVCKEFINDKQEAESLNLHRYLDCPVICYNGQAITFYGKEVNHKVETIPDALDVYEDIEYTGPIVIVGFKMMDRGISFVSSNRDKPYTASIMFYKSNPKIYAVSVAQRLGRITGSSRPDLNRTVYCDTKLYKDYQTFLANQEKLHAHLTQNQTMLIGDVCKMIGMAKLERPLDKPRLKKVNESYLKASSSSSVPNIQRQQDPDKMKRLVSSWSKKSNKSAVARLFRDIIDNGGMSCNKTVKEFVTENTSNGSFYTNLTAPKSNGNTNSLIFEKDSQNHYIKIEAMEYYNELQ